MNRIGEELLAELIKAFEAIQDVAWMLLGSSNPIQESTMRRCLKPLDEVIGKFKACQLLPQPLADKELREKLQHLWCQHCKALQKSNEALVVDCWYNPLDADKAYAFCATNCDAIDQILALLQPKIARFIKFVEWLRDEELVAEDDWDIHCKDKWQALQGKAK